MYIKIKFKITLKSNTKYSHRIFNLRYKIEIYKIYRLFLELVIKYLSINYIYQLKKNLSYQFSNSRYGVNCYIVTISIEM